MRTENGDLRVQLGALNQLYKEQGIQMERETSRAQTAIQEKLDAEKAFTDASSSNNGLIVLKNLLEEYKQ